jgi:hypothetical protein
MRNTNSGAAYSISSAKSVPCAENYKRHLFAVVFSASHLRQTVHTLKMFRWLSAGFPMANPSALYLLSERTFPECIIATVCSLFVPNNIV